MIATTGIALRQAHQAERQLQRAEIVTSFLSGMMGVVPSGEPSSLRSKGANLRVVDLVDTAAARVDRDLAGQPEAEAAIRYVLGSVYHQVGLQIQAERQAVKSARLFADFAPPGDPARLDAVILQATVQSQLYKYREAEQLLVEARQHWRVPSAYRVAALETVLGAAQIRLGKLIEAERTLRHCVADMEARLGRDNPWIGVALSNLALVHQERGQFERAAAHLGRAMAVARNRRAEAPEALGWAR